MKFEEYLARKRREYGDRFDPVNLDLRFVPYFESGQRIKVEDCGITHFGTVGVTSGWKPVFLLMRDRRAIGSSMLLTRHVRLIAVQQGKHYAPIV